MYAASDALKSALREILPNTGNRSTPDWIKLVARKIRLDPTRLYLLWRDGRAKIWTTEVWAIETALLEARAARMLREQRIRQKYLELVGVKEIEKLHTAETVDLAVLMERETP